MSCCPSNIVPFFDEAVTVVPYSDSMKAAFGPEPHVSVFYKDPVTGIWYTISGIMGTEVKYDESLSEILIDHGGVLTGFIKID